MKTALEHVQAESGDALRLIVVLERDPDGGWPPRLSEIEAHPKRGAVVLCDNPYLTVEHDLVVTDDTVELRLVIT